MGEKKLALTGKEMEWLDGALMLEAFFRGWSGDTISEVMPSLKLRAFDKGTPLVKEGDQGDDLYLLYQGTSDVTRGGKPIATLEPGDFFGEVSFITHAARSATVTAGAGCQAFSWNPAELKKVFDQNPGTFMRLEQIAKERIARL